MKRKLLTWSVLVVLALMLAAPMTMVGAVPIQQNAGGLEISEVLYDVTGGDDGYEWVELYNDSGSPILLTGSYSLRWGGLDYTYGCLDLTGTVPDDSTWVVGGPNSDASNGNPTYDQSANFNPDIQNGGAESDAVALFNIDCSSYTGTEVPIDAVIYDSPNSNNLIDETGSSGVSDVGDAPAGSSIELIGDPPNYTWQIQGTPNPGTANFTPTAITLSSFTARPITAQATFSHRRWLALALGLVSGGGAVARRLLGR